jgi:minor extracellular serine protease Vpr
MSHQAQRLEMEVRQAGSGSRVHPVFSTFLEADYLPRNSTAGGFFAFNWDGTRMHNRGQGNDNTKVVPNGDYVILVRVLKALGNPNNPDHWETWTSPVFTVERPAPPQPGQGRSR